MTPPNPEAPKVQLYSVVIPARNEASCIEQTVLQTHQALKDHHIEHEIILVDDGSTDGTLFKIRELESKIEEIRTLQNNGKHGFGRTVAAGIEAAKGDAIVIMMADASDSPEDAVTYYNKLNEGYDCVFGSRFIKGSKVIDYPKIKLFINRIANYFVKLLFGIALNDTTNAFKAYRKKTIDGIKPILSPHFNLTVELPLKAIVRGYSWTVVPICWTNRKSGVSKLKIKEMGSRYFFIVAYVWFEKFFSCGDYMRSPEED